MLNIRKSFWNVIKISVFVLLVMLFVKQLLKLSLQDFSSLALDKPWLMILVFLLFFLNWGLEFIKWYFIVRLVAVNTKIAILFRSLFAGIATGILTPNRMGNFIGRMVYFEGKNKIQLIAGTLYGNLAQFIASILLGAIGLFYLSEVYLTPNYSILAVSISFFTVFIALFFYFGYPYLSLPFLKNFEILRKARNSLEQFRPFAQKLIFPLLSISFLRYLVFVMQFIFVLMAFGTHFTMELILAVFLLYLLTTLTPSLLFGKLVIRETVALLVLNNFVENSAVIIISSLLLWMINLGLPALLGLTYFIKLKRVTE